MVVVGEDIEEVPKEATETTLVETTEDPVETTGDLVGAIEDLEDSSEGVMEEVILDKEEEEGRRRGGQTGAQPLVQEQLDTPNSLNR